MTLMMLVPKMTVIVSNKNNNRKGFYFKGVNSSLPDESSVFLPAAGGRHYSSGDGFTREERGSYWSSGLMDTYSAHSIYFYVPGSGQGTSLSSGGDFRASGNSVRCVLDQ